MRGLLEQKIVMVIANMIAKSIKKAEALFFKDARGSWLAFLCISATSAQLAALDLACMSVLVAASGGMLLGAADYKLGDLFITKGTVGKFSFQSAVQSFQDSFTRNIVNLSTVAIGAEARLGHDVPRCRGREREE
jgi:hypothetical protein